MTMINALCWDNVDEYLFTVISTQKKNKKILFTIVDTDEWLIVLFKIALAQLKPIEAKPV